MIKKKPHRLTPDLSRWGAYQKKTLMVVAAVILVATVVLAAGTPALIKMRQPEDPEMPQVVFKHWEHQRDYKCYACHPGLFSQWEKSLFNHDAMDQGKYCGGCHNGTVAFRPDDVECEDCHAE